MKTLLFLDTETTGIEKEDRLLQVAYKHGDTVVNELFKPPVMIKLPAMAVHHVTEKHVAMKHPFVGSVCHSALLGMSDSVLVAHNAQYDLGMLAKEGVTFEKHICTLKVARYLDNDRFENHQLQYLRYFYGIDLDVSAHDALGDVLVLEQVFYRLMNDLLEQRPELEIDTVVDRMIQISSSPSLIKKINFGKYRGYTLEEVARKDKDYLRWLLNEKLKKPEGEEDWIYSLRYYIK